MAPTYLPAIRKRRRGAEAPGARPLFRAIRKRKGTAAAFHRRCETGQEIIERHVREELEAMAGLAERNERCHKCGERPARSFIGCGDLLSPSCRPSCPAELAICCDCSQDDVPGVFVCQLCSCMWCAQCEPETAVHRNTRCALCDKRVCVRCQRRYCVQSSNAYALDWGTYHCKRCQHTPDAVAWRAARATRAI